MTQSAQYGGAQPAPQKQELIERLKAQHRQVEQLAAQLNLAVEAGNLPRTREVLRAFREGLLTHLALEDVELYPALIVGAQARGQPDREKLARTFATNMERISAALKTFLARYSTPTFDLAAFKHDWSELLTVLAGRIKAEESVLYPMYAALSGGKRTP